MYLSFCVRNGNCVHTKIFSANELTDPLVEAPSEKKRNKLNITSLRFHIGIENKRIVLKIL